MRRPVIYLVGLLLATGASFALAAGPASGAVSNGGQAAHPAYNPFDDGDEWYLVARPDAVARNDSGSLGGAARVNVTNNAVNSSKSCSAQEAPAPDQTATLENGDSPHTKLFCIL